MKHSSSATQQTQNRVTRRPSDPMVAKAFDTTCRALGLSHNDVAILTGNRVRRKAVQHWRRGRRGIPQWARDAIQKALQPRAAIIEHARELWRAQQKARDNARANCLPVE